VPLSIPVEDGHSFGAPLIAGSEAFFDADSDVFAVDLTSGQLLWRWRSGDRAAIGGYGGGTEIVAAADGVVVATQDETAGGVDVVGLDQRTGAVRWRHVRPGGYLSGLFDSGDGGVVFTAYTGPIQEVLNDGDGAVRWSGPAAPAPAPLAPFLGLRFASGDGEFIASALHGGIDAVSAQTGEVRWHYPGVVNDMVLADGLVLVTPPPGLRPAPYDVPTTALDLATGTAAWSSQPFDPGGSIWTAAGNALVHIENGPQSGGLSRIDPRTGRPMWNVTTEAYAAVGAGGDIVDMESTGYQSGPGSMVGRDPATGAVLWHSPLGMPGLIDAHLFAIDAAGGPIVIVRDGEQFVAFDVGSGAQAWQLSLPPDTGIDGATPADAGVILQVSQAEYAVQGH